MPYTSNNPVVAAILRRRSCPCPPLQVANGTRAMTLPDGDLTLDTALTEAWEPTIPGQAVPMIGERVYAEPCFDD
jgi:hypothetical protein